jgi:hypothetical protein
VLILGEDNNKKKNYISEISGESSLVDYAASTTGNTDLDEKFMAEALGMDIVPSASGAADDDDAADAAAPAKKRGWTAKAAKSKGPKTAPVLSQGVHSFTFLFYF